jgi:predicted phage tail protein
MIQTVRLLGDLGQRYGVEHKYTNLRTPAEAIKLLCINHPELQRELITAHEHGIGYRVIQAETDLDYPDLRLPIGQHDLIVAPVIAGSGGGTGTILAGVGLVAFAILTAGAGAGFLGAGLGLTGAIGAGGSLAAGGFVLGAAASTAIGAIGASLILGGVSQLLSPQPTIGNLGSNRLGSGDSLSTDGPQSVTRGTDGRQSYAYTGAANTVGVGATIPVAYGEVLIGSQLLSANVDVTDESDPLRNVIKTPGPETILFGGEKIGFSKTEASGIRCRRWEYDQVKFSDGNSSQKFLTLQQGNTIKLDEVEGEDDDRSKNYQVFFELQDGLFDRVSGEDSSFVDGFITYEIEVTTKVSGPDPVTATLRGTVQGLLLRGQRYRWMNYIKYAPIEDNRGVDTRVKIIDFRANEFCDLKVAMNGYNRFKDDSQNKA